MLRDEMRIQSERVSAKINKEKSKTGHVNGVDTQ